MNEKYKDLRDLFLLDKSVIFLNHGSFGATPWPVLTAYQHWQKELETQPVEFLGRRYQELLLHSRTCLARYLNTLPSDLVFTTNTTEGMNVILRSLNLRQGDEVLSTDHEYGAIDRTWRFNAQKKGFKLISSPIPFAIKTDADWLDYFWQSVTENTKVISISHITSPTATIFPIELVCKRARKSGITTIIDGAHAPGQIPIDLYSIDADFYVGNLHKWLCAPKGSAFIYAHPRVQNLVEPLVVSWGWQSENPTSSQFLDYLEWTGTRDLSAYLSIPAAIQFQIDHKWEEVRNYCHNLAIKTENLICSMTHLPSIYSDQSRYAQMVSILLPSNTNPETIKTALYEIYRIEVPILLWNNQVLIRVSYQGYNSPKDMSALIEAISRLI